jgi:hypothetical protein
MTNNNSPNKDKAFPIPEEMKDYYKYEFLCVLNKLKPFINIKQSHIQFLKITLVEFKKKILKPILDELEDAKNLSHDEKKYLIEFRANLEGF